MRSASRFASTARWIGVLGMLLVGTGGSVHGQIQEAKLIASAPGGGDNLGACVALEGNTAVIGSMGSSFCNRVITFEFASTGWHQQQVLSLSGADISSDSVDLSGDWLVVGSTLVDYIYWPCGRVHLFHRDSGQWSLKQTLSPTTCGGLGFFGNDVDIDGDRLVVAAFGEGAVHVYKLSGSTWFEESTLLPAGFDVGYSVSLDRTTIVVGAPAFNGGGAGRAFVFEMNAGQWQQTATLQPTSSSSQIGIGREVAVSGTTAMIWGGDTWTAYEIFVYEKGPSGWSNTQVLTIAMEPGDWTNTHQAIAIAGNTALLGWWTDSDLRYLTGTVFQLRRIDGRWQQVGRLLPTNPTPGTPGTFNFGSCMGWGLALSGDLVLAGAPYDKQAASPAAGAGFIFRLATDAIQYCSCRAQGPCANHDDYGGCASSASHGAVFQASGSGSITRDDLRMESRWMPVGVPAIVVMGPRPDEEPYGDGLICVGPGDKGLFRFPAGNSGLNGVITLGPGIAAQAQVNFPLAGHIYPGDTWYFQAWYRDPDGPCGSGFNLSNGLKVEFTQ